jgi:hypothetical protein
VFILTLLLYQQSSPDMKIQSKILINISVLVIKTMWQGREMNTGILWEFVSRADRLKT